MLDEADKDLQELLCKTSTFREVVDKDCQFFAKAGIIDYSLLLGRIETVDQLGDSTIDTLLDKIEEDPSLAHGVFVTQASNEGP